jgi:hypothetical protein
VICADFFYLEVLIAEIQSLRLAQTIEQGPRKVVSVAHLFKLLQTLRVSESDLGQGLQLFVVSHLQNYTHL